MDDDGSATLTELVFLQLRTATHTRDFSFKSRMGRFR
jgi:hypothetical protein